MKKLVFAILLVGLAGISKAQLAEILTDLYIEPMKTREYKNYTGYALEKYFLYTGEGKEGLYSYIVNRNSGAKIFELDERDLKARRHKPRFFGMDQDQTTVIVCLSLEDDYSWGSHILILEDGKVYHPGFIRYGVDNFNFASIGLYAQFEKQENGYHMFFQEDARLINYATEKIIPGANVEFLVTREKITRLK